MSIRFSIAQARINLAARVLGMQFLSILGWYSFPKTVNFTAVP